MTTQMTMEIQTAPGVWTDISSYVYQRDPVQITQGKSDEQSQAQPGHLSFTLDNRTGRFSPRNPLSDLYGKIGRNTPVRCKIDTGTYTRFYGEISSWPPRWDPSHSDNYVPVEAYGILRRLGQGQPPVSTALRDFILGQSTALAAYYPLSGGEETTYSQNLAPGETGSFRGVNGPIFTYGRDMPGWIGTGMELSATGAATYMFGSSRATGDHFTFDFVWQSPAMGRLTLTVWDTPQNRWLVDFQDDTNGATVWVRYVDNDSGSTFGFSTVGPFPELQDQALHAGRFEVATSGSDMNFSVYIDGTAVKSGTMSGFTWHDTQSFWCQYSRFTGQTVMNMAHLTMWTGTPVPSAPDMAAAALGHVGETAIARINRVAADGGISIGTVGTASESMVMGPQFTESRLAQIRDAEATDMGILGEDRTTGALLYRSRSSMYNGTPVFTLDYSALQVFEPLEPVDDDQTTRNDVTASRREGGSARYTVDTGPMSTQDPPDGVGRYDTDITVNVQTDGLLDGVAAWVANIGTLDKARWPSVTVNLSSPSISSTLRGQIKSAGVGDWFRITNMRKAFVYDDVNLIIVGYSETIDPFVHLWTANCMPAEPYTVAVYDTARYDADGSTLTSNVTSTATSISATNTTTVWTTDGTMFPFDIAVGGERMTVTNITGASTPQTLTVTRSVNGVVKAQTAGAEIVLWDTPRYAL